jgi:hypothetical protein
MKDNSEHADPVRCVEQEVFENVVLAAVDSEDDGAFLCITIARQAANTADYEKDGLVGREPCTCAGNCGQLWPSDAWYKRALEAFNEVCPWEPVIDPRSAAIGRWESAPDKSQIN